MATIQLLLSGDGNREAMASIVEEQHTAVTETDLQDADIYIVDEPSFARYREQLEAHKRDVEPVFCPVILVRREQTPVTVNLTDITTSEPPLLVNDVVTAPVDKQALFRTLSNLLARRTQTEKLASNLQKHNEQLREERQKYQTLVEQSQSGIAVTQDGTFAFVNDRMAEIAGRERAELRGMPVERIVVPEYQELIRTRHEQRIVGESPPTQYEIAIQSPDGERKDIDLRASRIEYEGDPAVLVLFRDISDRKKRERELRQFKKAVEHAGHGIVVTDEIGDIEYVNPAFADITGYTPGEAKGRNPRILKSGHHDKRFYQRLWSTILDGDSWNTEIINQRKSGERFVAAQTIAPILDQDDEIEGFVGIQDEITDRRLREQQLEVFHRVLRHNLRNKGTVILGYLDMLKRSLGDETALEQLETMETNLQSLLDISDKARQVRQTISSTASRGTDRKLVSALRTVSEEFRELYPNGDISVDIDADGVYRVDPRVVPALRELIENGIKHSDASVPRVSVSVRADSSTATVAIEDNGSGIPEHERHAIENGSEEPLEHGSGLGLWLAYWLIHYVGGDISLEVGNPGTTVSIVVPVRQ
jgi:PAS domain S-box-containing protein